MRIPVITALIISTQLLHASDDVTAPWQRHAFDVESGILWQAGDNTDINYKLVQTQFSWRSPYVFKWDLGGGSTIVVRNHASLIAAWIEKGRKIITSVSRDLHRWSGGLRIRCSRFISPSEEGSG